MSYEGLEQLHRFLFVLGITHVLYSCVAVGLAMSKVQHSLFIGPHLSMFTLGASCSFKGVLGYYMKTNQSVLCFYNIEGSFKLIKDEFIHILELMCGSFSFEGVLGYCIKTV